jgi:hypothetical protein
MSTFEVITLAYGIFVAGIFLYFWLMSKAIQTMTAIAWDTIPGVSLRARLRGGRIRCGFRRAARR